MTLEEWIAKQELTHAEAARVIGVSQPHVTMLVGKRRKPSLSLLQRVYAASDGRVTLEDW